MGLQEIRNIPISLRRWLITRTGEEIRRNNGVKSDDGPGKGQQIEKIKSVINALGIKSKG